MSPLTGKTGMSYFNFLRANELKELSFCFDPQLYDRVSTCYLEKTIIVLNCKPSAPFGGYRQLIIANSALEFKSSPQFVDTFPDCYLHNRGLFGVNLDSLQTYPEIVSCIALA